MGKEYSRYQSNLASVPFGSDILLFDNQSLYSVHALFGTGTPICSRSLSKIYSGHPSLKLSTRVATPTANDFCMPTWYFSARDSDIVSFFTQFQILDSSLTSYTSFLLRFASVSGNFMHIFGIKLDSANKNILYWKSDQTWASLGNNTFIHGQGFWHSLIINFSLSKSKYINTILDMDTHDLSSYAAQYENEVEDPAYSQLQIGTYNVTTTQSHIHLADILVSKSLILL